MRLPIILLSVFIALNAGVDTYIYKALRRHCKAVWPSRLHLILSILLFVLIVTAIFLPRRHCSNAMLVSIMWMLYTYLSFYLPKYLFFIIDLLSSVPRIFHRNKAKWLSATGAIMAALLFIVLWWGALVNRFQIQVKEVDIDIPNLPESFEGLRIAQISDLHVGTFGTDTTFVADLVERVNSLHPDVILFTGDIVNSKTDELPPHAYSLSCLSAPLGVYSILGNHDYGDYSEWPTPQAKHDNMQWLKELQDSMGWHLLLNETVYLHNDTDSIALIGVENIGDSPFPVYGSLTKAYPTLNDSVPKILMTHNPAHWVDSIADNHNVNVALSLSGHTHAMQIEVFGWSPSKYRYPTWGGLYKDRSSSHLLYVNIGDGTVGFPARIGATPEITLITLHKSK